LEGLKFCVRPSALAADEAVAPGDFLFIRTNGSKSLIGKGALVHSKYPRPHYFASYLIRLRLVDVESTPSWFALSWHGPAVRAQLLKVAASSAGQHNVSLSAAAGFALALPPAAEQVRVLSEISRLTSAADSVQSELSMSVHRVPRLRSAILKWAFEGKLVDQDLADEPAEKLLARIRADRAATTITKKNGKERLAR
jgi:type I restriction enzyme S subunit